MEKDTIITLEDNTMYALLDETVINDKKYFFAVELDDKKNPTTNYEIFENEIDNGEIYMNTLEDDNLKEAIMVNFTNNYINNLNKTIEES